MLIWIWIHIWIRIWIWMVRRFSETKSLLYIPHYMFYHYPLWWTSHKMNGIDNTNISLKKSFDVTHETKQDRTFKRCHNGRDSVSNHQPHDCLLNRLFRRRYKKTWKLRVTGLCGQMARNAENVFIWWRHPAKRCCIYPIPCSATIPFK